MKKRTFVRRLLALTTAAVMLFTVPAMAAFRDTAGHWAENTLTEWQEQGLIDGYSDGSFQPNGTMTRAAFVKLINRGLGLTDEAPISFTDVNEGDWFYAEIAIAVAAGYAQGSGDIFRPQQVITRAQAAAMIARVTGLSDNETRAEGFTDAASIPAWAKGSIGAAAEAGFMSGYADGTFRADGFITRAQAVVTLDRVRKNTQNTTIETAGTTLENKTVNGSLIIAESVCEGTVTLKNVTVLGSLIVKGGGANSIYLDGVRVGGTVRLQKENVHLCLMGDTVLDRVEIDLPCRITQDSSFKGVLGTLVIDLEKTSNQKVQIEVPAKRVELLSRANVVLDADVETLQIDKDAEGAQLDIKRGTTVGELTADAKVNLIGSGTVASLVVSVNGVTVSGSLSVKKTETEGGAKAPTVSSGSSSGGSGGRTLKEITGIVHITAEVPYGTETADALKTLPSEITLNAKDDSAVKTTATGWKWADGANYSGTTTGNYTATTAFTVPSGYTYSGTTTATATVTVKALDTNAFDAALAAAQALIDSTVTDEAAAATDNTKILITDKAANAITKGVRFTTEAKKTVLQSVIKGAEDAKLKGLASQQACDDQTKALTDAVTAFTNTLQTGTNTTTNAYLLQAVKNGGAINPNYSSEFAYSTEMQPLRNNYTYWLNGNSSWTEPGSGVTVSVDWSFSGDGAQYLVLAADGGYDHKKNLHSYGIRVTGQPDAPKKVTLTATVKRYDLDSSGTEVGKIDYTATIGAPIRVDTTATVTAPKITPVKNNDISLRVPLTGVEYITDIDTSKITVEGNTNTGQGEVSITSSSITDGGNWTKNSSGLFVPVTASCGYMPIMPVPTNRDEINDPMHATGKIKITIQPEALMVNEESGWYVPDGDLTYDAVVWGCNPAVMVLTQPVKGSHYTVSVNMVYMFEIRAIKVVYKTTDDRPSSDADGVLVSFSEKDGTQDTTIGQDGIVYGKKDVQLTPGTYHIWVMVDKDNTWQQVDGTFTVTDGSSAGDTP